MYWEIVPTPQGCQLRVDGVPRGSPAEPPPSGWLQRQFGILMPLEYEHARLSCNPPSWTGRPGIDPVMYEPRAVAGRRGPEIHGLQGMTPQAIRLAQECERLPPRTSRRTARQGDCVWYNGNWRYSPCKKREDFLPYCDPCTQALCGDFIMSGDELCPPMDCSGSPSTPVDPHARVDAFMQGYETQRAWMEAGGDGIAPRTWTSGCILVWTYQAEECPRGYHPVAWYPAPDGEDLALICCPGD